MDTLRTYLLTVVSASIICALVINFLGKKSPYSPIIMLLSGLFLSITVISPLTKLNLDNISSYFDDFGTEASAAVYDGTNMANTSVAAIIKENTEAYILDKANSFGATVNVDVSLNDDTPPLPVSVVIRGAVAPYVKVKIQEIIENDLAIPKENQSWI